MGSMLVVGTMIVMVKIVSHCLTDRQTTDGQQT